MQNKRLFVWICVGVLFGLIVVFALTSRRIDVVQTIPTTQEAFWISEDERKALTFAAEENNDANAAYRLAEYYIYSVNDYRTGRHWMELASRFGHKGAQSYLSNTNLGKQPR